MRKIYLIMLIFMMLTNSGYTKNKDSQVKIGMCTDVHLPTMHDADFRINTFMDRMKIEKPDFIIELGDFAEASEKFDKYYMLWDSFSGDKYHVIGNHEMDGGHSLEQALTSRNMKQDYYSFDKIHPTRNHEKNIKI